MMGRTGKTELNMADRIVECGVREEFEKTIQGVWLRLGACPLKYDNQTQTTWPKYGIK